MTWADLIKSKMDYTGEDYPDDVVACTLSRKYIEDHEFSQAHSGRLPKGFTLWTSDRVYFSSDYDHLPQVKSVQRHPPQDE